MRQFLRRVWFGLAALPFLQRFVLKFFFLAAVLFGVLFPHPEMFVAQLDHVRNSDRLIQTNFVGIAEINRQIDAALAPRPTRQQEFKAVEKFVLGHIRYQYDWDLWGNVDYWPNAQQVWAIKREDCDGRAILAASILRSRGYPEAQLVGNLSHVWVAVGPDELMGPQKEKNFQAHGRLGVVWPSKRMWLDGFAFFSRFPVERSLILFFATLLVALHPCSSRTRFFTATTIGLAGFVCLYQWGDLRMRNEIPGTNSSFWLGLSLWLGALLLTFGASFEPRMRARLLGWRTGRTRAQLSPALPDPIESES